jgi:hypothetical protein
LFLGELVEVAVTSEADDEQGEGGAELWTPFVEEIVAYDSHLVGRDDFVPAIQVDRVCPK